MIRLMGKLVAQSGHFSEEMSTLGSAMRKFLY
jgi:hypothetical protein